MKKIIIVGAGFSGSILARKIAEECNQPVQVIEKRNHIGGNMYDEEDKHGILVQQYGPHVLVTDRWMVIEYLSQFAKMSKYTVKELSFVDDKYVRLPFNFETVQQMIGPEKAEVLINKLRKQFIGRDRVPVGELVENEDEDISEFGNLLFEKCYRTYCAKQWGIPTELLDKSIMNRVPMAMSYDERYMNKDFQYIPEDGFTALFETMLDHPNISVKTNEDALEHIRLDDEQGIILYNEEPVDLLIYTGALDELFKMKYGELPYRSLEIKYDWYNEERMYPEAIISFPQAEGYTRKTEYKYLTPGSEKAHGTTIATEYPVPYVKGGQHAPYYPVITQQTIDLHELYKKEASKFEQLVYCGRLADFRYFNMDECILNSFEVFEKIKDKIKYDK